MPLFDFRCTNGHVNEIFVALEHDKWQPCPTCTFSAFQMPAAPTFVFNFKGKIVVNDYDDPWEGTPLAGGGEPNTLTYKSDKIWLDTGKVTSQGGGTKPVDYAQRIAEAQPPGGVK